MSKHNYTVQRAVRDALFVATMGAAILPQTTQAADDSIQEVVVTGSRISAPNMTSISPVTAIGAEDIALTGKVRVEDIINQLPQAMAAQGSNVSNGSTGTATVDLRGLNAKRTLVLINGRRLMPGNPDANPGANSGAADLNQIPRALIERVEVLTGGASSVYGADAVAGVVNFIMNTRFEGVKLEANYSFYNHENDNPVAEIVRTRGYELPESSINTGYTRDFSFVMGSNLADDRGNVTFYATYRDVDPVLQGEYDYSACTFNSGSVFTCGGSGTTAPTRMRPRDQDDNTGLTYILDESTGGLREYTATDAYNFGPLNFYQRPDERYTAGVFMELDVGEKQTAYSEFMFMKDRSVAQIAPSGIFLREFEVPCANPFFTADERRLLCEQYGRSTAANSTDTVKVQIGRRNVEGGPRQNDITHESYRAVLGLRGEINNAWSYDFYGQHGETNMSAISFNDFSIERTRRALDVVMHQGSPKCRSAVSGVDPACVPYNPWQPGGITQDQLDYLMIPISANGSTRERIVNASLTGDLSEQVKLPTANSGLMVNFGAEYRTEEAELLPDAAAQAGDGAGAGGATEPVAGGYRVYDLFGEARMALVEDRPFMQSLSAEAGYRFSDYDLDFSTDTYKLGMEWKPVEDLRARMSYQRSVRVPNVLELFGTQSVGLNGAIDVCAGRNPTLTPEQCARTGVTAAQYGRIAANSANQYNGLIGGNPDLQPETADTITLGLALQPSFVPGLRLQVDYFDIQIDNAIQAPNSDFTLLMCALNGDPVTCGRVHRNRDGSLFETPEGYIVDTFMNIGEIATSGFDFDASYAFDIGRGGRLGLDFVGTLLDSLETTPQQGVSYDCAGLYGAICGTPAPEWRHKMDATWRTPWRGVDITLSWRYFDAVTQDAADSNEYLAFLGKASGAKATDAELGSRSYIDLTGTLTLADKYTLRLGVNNLFDKDPPLNGGEACPTGPCNGNTWPQVYDALGRQIFGLVSIDF